MTKQAQSESRKRRDQAEIKEGQMAKALEAYRIEQEKEKKDQKSIRNIAIEFGVAHSTLSDRINGRQSIYEFNATKQKLSAAEEDTLVTLVSISSNCGLPYDHRTISRYANKIIQARLMEGEKFVPVGKHWVFTFLERHRKTIKTYWSKGLDTKRAQSLNPTAVEDWFNILHRELIEKGILPENTYAMDESGFPPSCEGTTRVVGEVGKKMQYKQGNASRENVTALVTICADGSSLTPLIVYKAQALQLRWTKKNVANARYVALY